MGRVSAIIPTWNRAGLLRNVLTDLSNQTRRPDQTIVVDNGSTDQTESVIREFQAEVVKFPENRGFAAAVNEGIRRAHGEWILILNNDVRLQPDWIGLLLGCAEDTGAPFVTGKLRRDQYSGTLDGSWDLISRAAYAWRCGFGRPDGAIWSTRRKIWFAPMTAAMFHRDVFAQIGLLDLRFGSYYEDVDFGIRCALAGLEGVYEPAAVALHQGHTTLAGNAGELYFLTARNQIFLLAKHYPAKTLRRFAWPILVGQTLAIFAAAKKKQGFAAFRGKLEGLRQWSRFRQDLKYSSSNPSALEAGNSVETAFSESEQEIRTIQEKIGFDIYWRLYFSLVRPG